MSVEVHCDDGGTCRSCGTVWPCAVVVAHRADSDKCVKCGCAGFRLVDGLCDGCHEADVFDPGG